MILMMMAVMAGTAFQDPNPLAPGRDGQVQCYEPDLVRKTCRAIGANRWLDDGTIVSDATVLLGDAPLIIMNASSPVYVRNGAECSKMTPAEAQITSISINGEPLVGDDFDTIRKDVGATMDEALGTGREYCSTYHAQPDGSLKALVTVDGEPRPDLTSAVLWVRREDGWRVAP